MKNRFQQIIRTEHNILNKELAEIDRKYRPFKKICIILIILILLSILTDIL